MRQRHFSSPAVSRLGFTLVELSVVLVIIGLVVGSIMAGRALLRNAEANAMGKEMQEIVSAVENFKLQYNALPGDMHNATMYWGIAGGTGTGAACMSVNSQTLSDPRRTCDGNGNKLIDPGGSGERQRFWQHLSNAGMYPGKFTGTAGPLGDSNHIRNVNSPPAIITSSAAWTTISLGSGVYFPGGGTTHSWPGLYGNILEAVKGMPTVTQDYDIITPAEMLRLDSKFDDGIPSKGLIRTYDGVSKNVGCSTSTDPDLARYNVGNPNPVCAFRRLQAY